MLFLLIAVAYAKLLAVIELAREPTCYPKTAFRFSSEEDLENIGKLNIVGKKQEEMLADIIKKRYWNVFKDNFRHNSTIYVKNRDCAVDAIKTQLNTIYGNEMFSALKVTETQDFMLSPEVHCDRLKSMLDKNIEKFKEHEIFSQVIQNPQIGILLDTATVDQIYKLGEFILSYEERELDLSENLSNDLKNAVKTIYFKYHEWLLYGSKEQGKLGLNEIIRKLNDFLQVSVRKGKYQRFLPFMLDEGLFLAALHILGVNFDPKPAGSALFLEVHQVSNKEKIRFWNQTGYIESELCGLECELKDFTSHLSSLIAAKPIQTLCKASTSSELNKENFILVGVLLLILILVAKYHEKVLSLFSKNKSD